MSRASVKASTSPSTPSAPTTCKSPPGRGLLGGRAHNYGLGHIPGNVPAVEGLQRKLEPLSFWTRALLGRHKLNCIAASLLNIMLSILEQDFMRLPYCLVWCFLLL